MLILDDYCFICGKANPKGLRIGFRYENGYAEAEFELEKEYQGYRGIVHGGIISAIIDEACAYATLSLGLKAYTAKMNVRFRRPVKTGEKLSVSSTAILVKSRLVEAKASIKDKEGNVVAEGDAKFIVYNEDKS
ncbi:MAG: PaaI family thioesterase [Deltaproteobacteria bacterium]|nr:PaaI family thioesterase [Deltaproteobacteria bacterium]